MQKSILAAVILLWAIVPSRLYAEWETLRDCRLLDNPSNDGDSFHVSYDGKEFIFRLYFVDTPESDDSFPDRVNDQAVHFGITFDRTLKVGKFATKVTAKVLSRPFTVVTRGQDARGRSNLPRYYAFVRTDREEDLAGLLVGNGLARVYGVRAAPPNSDSIAALSEKYAEVESQARRQQVGAYGRGSLRLTRGVEDWNAAPLSSPVESRQADVAPIVTPSQSPEPRDVELLEKIPEIRPVGLLEGILARVNASNQQLLEKNSEKMAREGGYLKIPGQPQKSNSPDLKSDSEKLDLNAATYRELQQLPGIGPSLASEIIKRRPFTSSEELLTVPGIGPKKYAKLRPLVSQ
jgi:endonuclease YncB( thermonuclease family)